MPGIHQKFTSVPEESSLKSAKKSCDFVLRKLLLPYSNMYKALRKIKQHQSSARVFGKSTVPETNQS